MRLKDAITKRFFDLINENDISMHQIEKKSNIAHSTMNTAINRCKKYSIDIVEAMAYGLDMSIREFFDDPIFDDVDRE